MRHFRDSAAFLVLAAALIGSSLDSPLRGAGPPPTTTTAPAAGAAEFRFDPREEQFTSPLDGTRQTYLLHTFPARPAAREARGGERRPLLAIYLHGSGSHQDQGMKTGIYGNVFGRLGEWL